MRRGAETADPRRSPGDHRGAPEGGTRLTAEVLVFERLRPARHRTCGPVEALERRRLLATITGTEGPDTITVTASGGTLHVSFEGGGSQSTSDATVTISTLGGNDSVYLDQLLE